MQNQVNSKEMHHLLYGFLSGERCHCIFKSITNIQVKKKKGGSWAHSSSHALHKCVCVCERERERETQRGGGETVTETERQRDRQAPRQADRV